MIKSYSDQSDDLLEELREAKPRRGYGTGRGQVTLPSDMNEHVREAVRHFWSTRAAQQKAQQTRGSRDQGARGAVTGGAQMDGFVKLIVSLAEIAGAKPTDVYRDKRLCDLPGFFRATKQWDLLVVSEKRLILTLEAKSQVGSFGNNFNNRTEEAMGSALDFWTAYREGAFGTQRPWLGYLFLLEDCPSCTRPVAAREPHFPVLPEFRNTSYAQRYQIFCRKLVLERHYDAACFLMSGMEAGLEGEFSQPEQELCFEQFAKSLVAHVGAYLQ